MGSKRLYRTEGPYKMLCGVCGGIAEYFGIDPTIVRLICLLLCLGYGSGLLIYIIAALVIPEPPVDPYQP